ncbi:MAG: hypothetical protein ACYC5A_10090 [Thermoleophilia bacterium]
MRKYLIITSIMLFAGVIGYISFYPFDCDNLPPKTAQKTARRISGLNVSQNVEIIHFEHTDNDFNGDYSNEIVLQLSSAQINELREEWNQKGYDDEPFTYPDPENVQAQESEDYIANNIASSDETVYWRKRTQQYLSIVILNMSNNRLIIYESSS